MFKIKNHKKDELSHRSDHRYPLKENNYNYYSKIDKKGNTKLHKFIFDRLYYYDCFLFKELNKEYINDIEFLFEDLAKYGFDFNHKNNLGYNLFHMLILSDMFFEPRKFKKIFDILIKYNIDINSKSKEGDAPLMLFFKKANNSADLSCKRRIHESVCLFIYNGADLSVRNVSGRSIFMEYFMCFCNSGAIMILDYIIELTEDKKNVNHKIKYEVKNTIDKYNGYLLNQKIYKKVYDPPLCVIS